MNKKELEMKSEELEKNFLQQLMDTSKILRELVEEYVKFKQGAGEKPAESFQTVRLQHKSTGRYSRSS